ncbi:MAG: CapA family protein [Acidobacteriota bacterium]|jgi:poly-gamma-glutamate synthesis protein (capsule biosynthesis protein)|nr:CapA family protein [Acidobacteriota bacterium]
MRNNATLKLMLVGDLILDEPDPDSFFDLTRGALREADVVIGHVEVPHTRRGRENTSDVPAPPSDPDNLAALKRAGFHIATLAGNHIHDAGPDGIEDTIAALRQSGIVPTGAGMCLAEARKPAVVVCNGLKVGVLSYNCVGPKDSWANEKKAGCAWVHVITHYELDHASPGGPPRIYTFAEPESTEAMLTDVENVRREVDVLVVALHKGIGHTPAVLAMYERPLAKAVIDAGADIVIGHHAHILRGIEVYKGKPIYHGLGNFVTVTRALNIESNPSPKRLEWARRRRELFGFEPDPDYPTYPFHPEARNAMIAVCEIGNGGALKAGFLPCWVNPKGQPEICGKDARGRAVAAYIEQITRKAALNADFAWDGDWVRFL